MQLHPALAELRRSRPAILRALGVPLPWTPLVIAVISAFVAWMLRDQQTLAVLPLCVAAGCVWLAGRRNERGWVQRVAHLRIACVVDRFMLNQRRALTLVVNLDGATGTPPDQLAGLATRLRQLEAGETAGTQDEQAWLTMPRSGRTTAPLPESIAGNSSTWLMRLYDDDSRVPDDAVFTGLLVITKRIRKQLEISESTGAWINGTVVLRPFAILALPVNLIRFLFLLRDREAVHPTGAIIVPWGMLPAACRATTARHPR
ncbi:MAG: hypothetical protein AB7K09_06395 [Planctomycetota bacterium]